MQLFLLLVHQPFGVLFSLQLLLLPTRRTNCCYVVAWVSYLCCAAAFSLGCRSTGPCTLSLLQALRAVSSADGGLYRLLQHSKLLLQMQRFPSYAVLRSEAVEEVAVV